MPATSGVLDRLIRAWVSSCGVTFTSGPISHDKCPTTSDSSLVATSLWRRILDCSLQPGLFNSACVAGGRIVQYRLGAYRIGVT